MKACKFCGVLEGVRDRNGQLAHINRDNLCAPCYRVLEQVKYQPEMVSKPTMDWFVDMCKFNIQHGMFVPIRQRRELAHLKPTPLWSCRRCGTVRLTDQDFGYKSYCVMCADEIRTKRMEGQKPRTSFKRRSDKGGKHLKDKAKI